MTFQRRHLILDVTAVAIGLYRYLGLTDDVLDAGCHAGTISSLLAEVLDCDVTGIDLSREAIEFGRKHPARHSRVSLQQASMPWMTDRRFGMVISASAMPWSGPSSLAFLKSISGRYSGTTRMRRAVRREIRLRRSSGPSGAIKPSRPQPEVHPTLCLMASCIDLVRGCAIEQGGPMT
jgi:SAM-dependent methyltransferase